MCVCVAQALFGALDTERCVCAVRCGAVLPRASFVAAMSESQFTAARNCESQTREVAAASAAPVAPESTLATLADLTPEGRCETEAFGDDADSSDHSSIRPNDEAIGAQRCFDSVFVQGLKDSNGGGVNSKVNTWRMLAEDRLSVDCSFVLCDATKIGFPLAFVSRGFSETAVSP